MKAYVFPGQGSQFPGMGKSLYESSVKARELFNQANRILGFEITQVMFNGTEDQLKETKVTQPAIFLHSVILALTSNKFNPEMVAGHSLGEFSALVASGALSFEHGLSLVLKRALAMQKACEKTLGTMAAIIGMEDKVVEDICASISEMVIVANYNCPGQVVISGSKAGVENACERLKKEGAKRALLLPVGGAFHSPLMSPAHEELQKAIETTIFSNPICLIYQNVSTTGTTDIKEIKKNLITQLTSPVRWTQSIQQMVADGASLFTESGPGKVLQNLVKKINRNVKVASIASE